MKLYALKMTNFRGYYGVCFWQVKRGPPSAVQMGTTPGKNIYLSSHLSFSSSSSL